MRHLRTLAAALVVSLVACDEPTGPQSVVELADIAAGSQGVVTLSLEDDDLLVDIVTYGNPCTTAHHDEVDVDQDARLVTIHPYNEVDTGTCFASLVEIPHQVRVGIEQPGEWRVRVVGRGTPISVDPQDPQQSTVVVESRIDVTLH